MSNIAEIILQSVQIAGSLFILVAFIASSTGKTVPSSWGYLIANAVGSAILTVTAVITLEWGFILLEGVWVLVSIISMIRKSAGTASPLNEQPQSMD